jgi:catechol 2,3-dioxygenase-like lactoylglutathione lyase family enzyme
MYDIGLTHIALPVTSPGESIAFYAKYARMQVIHRRPGVVWLTDKTRPFVIVLIEKPEVDHALSFGHLGVGCESREEVDRLCDLVRAEGRLINEPEDAGPPIGYWAFIRDPDGHMLEVSFGQEVGLTVAQATSPAPPADG